MCLGDKGVPATDVPAMALLAQLPDARQLEVLRVRTAAGLGASIERVCNRYSRSMVKGLQERWSQLDALADKPVELTLPSGEILQGRTAGISDGGELLFIDALGRTRMFADARIRPLLTNREKQ